LLRMMDEGVEPAGGCVAGGLVARDNQQGKVRKQFERRNRLAIDQSVG
jgi:hypothetical protein